MKIPVIFSTITGNAYKLASAVSEVIDNHIGPYNIFYINQEVIDKFDVFVLTYWCDKGSVDPETMKLLSMMKGKKIVILGTLGAAMNSKHAEAVKLNVEKLVKKDNELLGNFLCRGSIDLARTAQKLSIPEGEKGHLPLERFLKQHESLGHPNALDLRHAQEFVIDALKEYC